MIRALDRMVRRARSTTFVQAVRVIELLARVRGNEGSSGPIGTDTPLAEEPLHFAASDRMRLPIGDIDEIVAAPAERPRILANVMGLVGATPALPSFYSEMQLQRRRLRDSSMAGFYNIFDHRALSFFYRAASKYHWLLGYERAGAGRREPVSDALLALGGFASPGTRDRLAFDDALLAPLAGRIGDRRRSAGAVEAALRHVTGLPLTIRQAVPTWMALPAAEQTRIGTSATRRFARLGGGIGGAGEPDAAVLGAAVLDVQHHYAIEAAPLPYASFLSCVTGGTMLQQIRDVCRIAAGIEQRPTLRLRIAANELPPLQLGRADAPAVLGRTTWLGSLETCGAVLDDCTIPISVAS